MFRDLAHCEREKKRFFEMDEAIDNAVDAGEFVEYREMYGYWRRQ